MVSKERKHRVIITIIELGRSRPFGVSATLTLCTCAISSNPIICTSAHPQTHNMKTKVDMKTEEDEGIAVV